MRTKALLIAVLLAVGVATGCARADDGEQFTIRDTADGAVAVDSVGRLLAEFTDGARTVLVHGPQRTLRDPLLTTTAVTSDAWIRLLPRPWSRNARDADGVADWLAQAQNWREPDALAVAFEYVEGAPDGYDGDGVRYRGDADFGPLADDGVHRLEGGDFHDYLGLPWQFPDGSRRALTRTELGAVDCSGFLRLVFGYRLGLPLTVAPDDGAGLPRIADDIGRHGPGLLLADTHAAAVRTVDDGLRPGDLVFFDTDSSPRWNHSGIYLGRDQAGGHRFISSRSTANGPTMADLAGPSLLTGTGLYARGFVAVRRL